MMAMIYALIKMKMLRWGFSKRKPRCSRSEDSTVCLFGRMRGSSKETLRHDWQLSVFLTCTCRSRARHTLWLKMQPGSFYEEAPIRFLRRSSCSGSWWEQKKPFFLKIPLLTRSEKDWCDNTCCQHFPVNISLIRWKVNKLHSFN